MSAIAEVSTDPVETPDEVSPPAPTSEWKTDVKGRDYHARRGRSGIVYRKGNETVDEALARDEKARDEEPRPKPKPKAKKAPAPTAKTSQEIEHALKELLQMPALIGAGMGDRYLQQHFMATAPTLARNVVSASEHDPWLRGKLEAITSGDEIFGKLMMRAGVAMALAEYGIPPILYLLGDRGPRQLKEVFKVPDRPDKPAPEVQNADPESTEAGTDAAAAAA